MSLDTHREKWKTCTECTIGACAQNHVFWRGNSTQPTLMFIGEGPGRRENRVGLPFVGRSGEILDAMIVDAGVDDYVITNLVLCRPCDGAYSPNRAPTWSEVENCGGRLREFLGIMKPKGLIVVGRMTNRLIVNARIPHYDKYPKCVIDHPSYIARTGGIGTEKYRDVVSLIRMLWNRLRKEMWYGEDTKTTQTKT